MQCGGQGIRAEVGRYSTLERASILDYWPGHLVAGSHKLLHRSTPIEPVAAGVPAHGGDTERIEAHGKANIAASRTRARQPGLPQTIVTRRAARPRNRPGRRQSDRRPRATGPPRSPAGRARRSRQRRSFRPRQSALHRVIEHDAEAAGSSRLRILGCGRGRTPRDDSARLLLGTCQPARPASRTTLLSAGSSPSQ
jgi:hypothetical protein